MIGSSVLHGTDVIEGGLPPSVRNVALVGIGALIGARFARMKIRTMLSHVNAALDRSPSPSSFRRCLSW